MIAAIVVAAGRGTRMGGPIPKQYRDLGGIPVIRHTLLAFLRNAAVTHVQPVIHPADLDLYEAATKGLSLPEPVIGGGTRQETVRFGLSSLAALSPAPGKVIIHDAVRPLVEQKTIQAVIEALDRVPAVITGLPVADTLKRCSLGLVDDTVDRTGIWRAQTPQGFHFEKILRAHAEVHFRDPINADLTDDSLVVERAGLRVAMVEGTEDNFKITTERDLARAEEIILRGHLEMRMGWGFDFEALGAGDHVLLCDIPVPHGQGIARAQNADIPLNAVTDALLGTIGGVADGGHFQATRPGFRGAASDFFLRQTMALVAMRGGRIAHVDLTVLAPAPKIDPHLADMTRRLAALLSVDPARVSVKQITGVATSLFGRGDGISAQCLVTTQYPSDPDDSVARS